jgi:hypothetical protein
MILMKVPGARLHRSDANLSMVPYPPLLFHVMIVRDKHTSCAVSRLLSVGLSNVPIMNFPSTVVLHPFGAAASGATPSGGPCARLVAARQKSGARIDVRILNVYDVLRFNGPTRAQSCSMVDAGGRILSSKKKVQTPNKCSYKDNAGKTSRINRCRGKMPETRRLASDDQPVDICWCNASRASAMTVKRPEARPTRAKASCTCRSRPQRERSNARACLFMGPCADCVDIIGTGVSIWDVD